MEKPESDEPHSRVYFLRIISPKWIQSPEPLYITTHFNRGFLFPAYQNFSWETFQTIIMDEVKKYDFISDVV